MNKNREDDGESRAADGADQRDEIIQLRYTDCHDACEETRDKIRPGKHRSVPLVLVFRFYYWILSTDSEVTTAFAAVLQEGIARQLSFK